VGCCGGVVVLGRWFCCVCVFVVFVVLSFFFCFVFFVERDTEGTGEIDGHDIGGILEAD